MNDLGNPGRSIALAMVLAIALALVLVVVGYAGRAAEWQATEFQLQNLDNVPADYVARFLDLAGTQVLTLTGSIPVGRGVYIRPEEEHGLPEAFTGTLRVESDQQIAGAVLHLASPSYPGNDVFQMISDDTVATDYNLPLLQSGGPERDLWSVILIMNLGLDDAIGQVEFYDAGGVLALEWPFVQVPIPPLGRLEIDLFDLIQQGLLPAGFDGSAVVAADQPIGVDVVTMSGGHWAIYAAPSQGSTRLIAPMVEGYQQGQVTPTIVLQNMIDIHADVSLCGVTSAVCQAAPLPGSGTVLVPIESPITDAYLISATTPVAGVVAVRSADGFAHYAAQPVELAATHLAAPMLFDDYQGWDTSIWVFNPGDIAATLAVTYTGVPTPQHAVVGAEVPPGEALPLEATLGMTHTMARLAADQPVLALVRGENGTVEDGRFAYWTSPYVPMRVETIYLPLVMSDGPSTIIDP